MTPFRLRLGLSTAVSLLLTAAASASVHTPRGLVVTDLTVGPSDAWRLGSLLVRVQVSNPTASEQHVRVRWFDGYDCNVSTDVDVPAGAVAFVKLPVPQVPRSYYGSLQVVDGSGKTTDVDLSGARNFRSWNDNDLPLYVSRSLSAEALRDRIQTAIEEEKKKSSHARFASFSPKAVRAADFPDPWPDDWRGYSVFAGVLIDERDLPDLSSGARSALLDYAAAGGSVFFAGADAIPTEFAEGPFTGLVDSEAEEEPPAPGCTVRRCGLGFLATIPLEVATLVDPPHETTLSFLMRLATASHQELSNLAGPFPNEPDVGTMGGVYRKAGETFRPFRPIDFMPEGVETLGKPPVGTFLLILLAFSVLAGPVAISVLARRNRRIHLLWVLPAVSAVFSIAIVASLLAAEGVRPTLRLWSAAVLDQRSGRFISHDRVFAYSPLTLRSLDLPADAAVLVGDGTSGRGSVQMGRTAVFSGWLAPRMPGQFLLLRACSTPLRLDIREDPAGGAPTVVNALGVPVANLSVFDSRGVAWRADGAIAPGATATLVPAPGEFPIPVHQLGGMFPEVAGEKAPLLATRSLYRAELDGSPFLEDPLPGHRAHRKGRTVLYGKF